MCHGQACTRTVSAKSKIQADYNPEIQPSGSTCSRNDTVSQQSVTSTLCYSAKMYLVHASFGNKDHSHNTMQRNLLYGRSSTDLEVGCRQTDRETKNERKKREKEKRNEKKRKEK